MKEKIRTIIPNESDRNLFYSDSESDFAQALVGYLRMDFGKSGTEFFNKWFGKNCDLADNNFINELNSLVAELKKSLLKSRTDMSKYIHEHDGIEMQDLESYKGKGFQFAMKYNVYFLRCIPKQGDYDCYCYVYNKAMLEQIFAESEQNETQTMGGISQ